MKLKIIKLEKNMADAWDQFVSSSPNGTIFHTSTWLKASPTPFDFWGIYTGHNLVGGFAAPYRKILGQKLLTPSFLSPYTGLMFKNGEGNAVKRLSFENSATKMVADLLKREYMWGVLKLHFSVLDMRPFIWQGFKVSVRYTLTLDVSDLSAVEKMFPKSLRHSIKSAKKIGMKVIAGGNGSIERALALVEKTYAYQQIKFRKEEIKNYVNALAQKNLCVALVCVDAQGHDIASSVIVWDDKRAYGLLAGLDRNYKRPGAQCLCEYETIKFISRQLGRKNYDMCTGMIPHIQEFYRKYSDRLNPCYEIQWGRGYESARQLKGVLSRLRNGGK